MYTVAYVTRGAVTREMAAVIAMQFLEYLVRCVEAVHEGFPEVEAVAAWRRALTALSDTAAENPDAALAFMGAWHRIMRTLPDGSPRPVALYDFVRVRDVDGLLAADLTAADDALGTPHGATTATLATVLLDPDMTEATVADTLEYVQQAGVMARFHANMPSNLLGKAHGIMTHVSAGAPVTDDTTVTVMQQVMQDPGLMASWATEMTVNLQQDTHLLNDILHSNLFKTGVSRVQETMLGGGATGADGVPQLGGLASIALSTLATIRGGGGGSGSEAADGGLPGGLDVSGLLGLFTGLQPAAAAPADADAGAGAAADATTAFDATASPGGSFATMLSGLTGDHPLTGLLQGALGMMQQQQQQQATPATGVTAAVDITDTSDT
jgi:hypothetical protein